MKLKIFCVSLLLPCFVLSASAHPGGTDSKGGHKNHSTGEYHYHHGYSAHDHYDMDGDGDLDCPYTFKDKTNSSNSSKSNQSSSKPNDYSMDDVKRLAGIIAVMYGVPFLITKIKK